MAEFLAVPVDDSSGKPKRVRSYGGGRGRRQDPNALDPRSQYKARYVAMAKLACEKGFTDYQLRSLFGISAETMDRWRLLYPAFDAAIKTGRGPADERVVRSAHEKAVGYYADAEKVFIDRDGNVVRVSIKEYVPPSDKAQEFWLTNRLPDEWKSRQEVKHSGGVINLNVTAEDLLL